MGNTQAAVLTLCIAIAIDDQCALIVVFNLIGFADLIFFHKVFGCANGRCFSGIIRWSAAVADAGINNAAAAARRRSIDCCVRFQFDYFVMNVFDLIVGTI